MPDGLLGVLLGGDEADDFVLALGFSLALEAVVPVAEAFEGLAAEAEDRAGPRRALHPLKTLTAVDELDIDRAFLLLLRYRYRVTMMVALPSGVRSLLVERAQMEVEGFSSAAITCSITPPKKKYLKKKRKTMEKRRTCQLSVKSGSYGPVCLISLHTENQTEPNRPSTVLRLRGYVSATPPNFISSGRELQRALPSCSSLRFVIQLRRSLGLGGVWEELHAVDGSK